MAHPASRIPHPGLHGLAAAALLAVLLAGGASAQDPGGMPEGGKPQVEVKQFPHAPSCPSKCKTCTAMMGKALDYLAKKMQGDGLEAGNGGETVCTSIAGLAFMANGSTPTSGPHAKQIEMAAQAVLRRVGSKTKGKNAQGMEFEGFGNWDLGFGAWFLAEYYAQKPSPAVEQKLKFICEKICEQREPCGGWGHAPNFAYKDLVVVTNACLMGLGSLKMVRIPVPDDVIARGAKYLEDSSSGGTVGYSPREGQKGWGHAGRASGAGYAMTKCGVANGFHKSVCTFVKGSLKSIPKDHASPTLHYLFGGLFSYMLGADAWREFRGLYLDPWLSAQQADGSFKCPTKSDVQEMMGMDPDGMVGPNYMTSVFALVFALPLEKTNLTRVKLKEGKPTATAGGLGLGKKDPTNAWLGVRVVAFGEALAVKSVVKDSPAAAAGLADGDAILEINRKPAKDAKTAREAIQQIKPGTKVTLTVLHAGEKKAVEVTLGEKPKPPEAKEGGEAPPVETGEGEEI